MTQIIFGTDGWRGRIAEDYTFDNVRRCAQGFASFLQATGAAEKGAVIGYDQRFAAEHFAAAAAEVLAANGVRVWLTQSNTPTPAISYSVQAKGAAGAINITASHNPPGDCGFKVRDEVGGAIPPDDLKRIEAGIPDIGRVKRMKLDDAMSDGLVRLFDPAPDYIALIHKLVDIEPIKAAGFNVLVDCMWGNGAGWFPRLLAGGKTQVHEVHNERNPIFPQMLRPEPIPPNIDDGLSYVGKLGADVAIITDGDADRVGLGDENGRFIDQLRVYGLLGYYFLEVRGERGPIVKTISTTKMLNKLGAIYNVPIYETGVGFKYIAPKMKETDALLGGEESGGYAFRGHAPDRDGILAGLYLLDMMVQTGKRPSQLLDWLFEKVGPALLRPHRHRLRDGAPRRGSGPGFGRPPGAHRRAESDEHRHARRLPVPHGRRRLAAHSLQRHRADHPRLLRDNPRRQGAGYFAGWAADCRITVSQWVSRPVDQ
jgi:phosphomannomutase